MKWLNAVKDGFPKDKQEVVICVNGVNYPAVFYELDKTFVATGYVSLRFTTQEYVIYWVEVINGDSEK
ncbi:MAG: hypothetical protein HYX39_09620 [Bacteroidetes bacterium]|nr:hypothetical protein [Bacteroidota bacterium]